MELLNPLFKEPNRTNSFFLIAGPCVIENYKIVEETATHLIQLCDELEIPFLFKSSYTKANRSSIHSFTGIGNKQALEILAEIKQKYNVPIVTDIHTEEEAAIASEYVDVLQIPAFLCRQTSLLVAAAKTGKYVNIKKGQFLSPEAMQFAVSKITSSGNEKVMVTERGTSFGYTDLIVDYRGIPVMKKFGKPVIMDCTHALQQPNQPSGVTGGKPELIETIAKCAIAAGVDGLFIETHPKPSEALSDGANMLPLPEMKSLLQKLIKIRQAIIE
ncbi:MAG: 3-deoxy-8-phosphooctulonate synthase [Chitinophagaceae bacterium]|nr:MAG: 2-dehydro-3-deoxyphosphooctonate aldolase [Bacteroidetes bacterium OLB11]MCC6448109.1 3-deoxy-8-phosphooctulonate synthase [Chitinophagaceae bacterium]HMN33179.1 3-deoxy-8-phosphooctulonate synthase [Chitinophagaceae bacterium]